MSIRTRASVKYLRTITNYEVTMQSQILIKEEIHIPNSYLSTMHKLAYKTPLLVVDRTSHTHETMR